jgi:hypothetical protein
MKITKNTITFFQLVILIFFIIIICKSINYMQIKSFTNKKEYFTSGFREMYRPYIRNVRLIGEKYHNKIKQNNNSFFRKFGLI